MERYNNVTLQEAYKLMLNNNGYAFWTVSGNYLNFNYEVDNEDMTTYVFLGASIFILGIETEKDETPTKIDIVDFMDIWPSVKKKYPQLFEAEVKGDVMITP